MTDVRTAREMEPDPALLAAALTPQHVADVVEVLNEQPPEIVSRVLAHLPFDLAVEVLDQPNLESAALMQGMPAEQALTFLPAMSADRAADLFRHLEEPVRSQLLARLDPAARVSLQQLLAYPPDTAGSLMTTEFVSVPPPGPSNGRFSTFGTSNAPARPYTPSTFSIPRPRRWSGH